MIGTLAQKKLMIFGALMKKIVNNENGEASGKVANVI